MMSPESESARRFRELEEFQAKAEKDMEYVIRKLDGHNGEPGVLKTLADLGYDFKSWKSLWSQREADKKTFDDRSEKRQIGIRGWIVALTGFLALLVTLAGVIIGVLTYEHETHHTLFSQQTTLYDASINFNATK